MHPQAIAGFLGAWTVALLAVAVYCLSTYRRRSNDAGYLVFGLLTLALAVFDGGSAWYYVGQDIGSLRAAVTVAMSGRIAATALLLHYVLHDAESSWKKSAIALLYGIAGAFEIGNLADWFYEFEAAQHRQVRVFGVVLNELAVPVRIPAIVFSAFAVVVTLTATAVLARAFLRGRRETRASLLGAVILSVTVIHDGLRTVGVTVSPVLVPYGYAVFVLGVILTLVARYALLRRQLEARTLELKQQSGELSRSYEDLRAAQTELVRKEQLAVVGELSAVIAHEVRNPLAIINNAVATLRRSALGANDRETLLGILDEESSRLNRLVGDLLQFARPVSIERQHVSIREIVERALALVQGRADIDVELVEPEPVGKIWGDPQLLRQVVENLITNALQAMSGGGALTITLVPEQHEGAAGVELQIQDTGEGMDTTVRNRALDPFFTTRPSGTGLGLAIVSRFVDAHGGNLRIRSAAGAGTVLHVFLPIGSGEAAASYRSRSDLRARSSSHPPLPDTLRKALGG